MSDDFTPGPGKSPMRCPCNDPSLFAAISDDDNNPATPAGIHLPLMHSRSNNRTPAKMPPFFGIEPSPCPRTGDQPELPPLLGREPNNHGIKISPPVHPVGLSARQPILNHLVRGGSPFVWGGSSLHAPLYAISGPFSDVR